MSPNYWRKMCNKCYQIIEGKMCNIPLKGPKKCLSWSDSRREKAKKNKVEREREMICVVAGQFREIFKWVPWPPKALLSLSLQVITPVRLLPVWMHQGLRCFSSEISKFPSQTQYLHLSVTSLPLITLRRCSLSLLGTFNLFEWPTSPSPLTIFWLNRFHCKLLSTLYSFTFLKTFGQSYHANS